MPEHLIAITIGPIQDFISAGRRTRDLWFGSKLLSDISREGAVAVERKGGEVIFPGPSALANKKAGIANVILARLADQEPEEVAKLARAACNRLWRDRATVARNRVPDLIRQDVWEEQLAGVIEFYAAWTPLFAGDYQGSRRRVMRLLAARKLVRDFPAWNGHAGLPKSSLDGARETVLVAFTDRAEDIPAKVARQVRPSRGEQLDIVGLTKRLNQPRGFPSVSRIAADTWIRNLPPGSLAELNRLCQTLANDERLMLIKVPDDKFPFEGSAVYRNRHHELARENADLKEDAKQLPPEYHELTAYVEQLEREFGIPDPYVACIAADGDRIGKALSGKTDHRRHQAFSDTLAGFARRAEEIVDDNFGSLVYSGGDDVLAFVPVSRSLRCAIQLRNEFRKLVAPEAPGSSLSVGIAIAHFLDNMEDHLEYARHAEKHAKDGNPDENGRLDPDLQKDGLAVHVHPRGGAPVKVRARWDGGLPQRLRRWTEAYLDGSLSSKSSYDLRRLLAEYRIDKSRRWDDSSFVAAFPSEAARVLSGKSTTPKAAAEIRAALESAKNWLEAAQKVDEMIVARRFASAVRQPSKLKGVPGVLQLAD